MKTQGIGSFFPNITEDPLSTNEICLLIEEIINKNGNLVEYTYKL